MNIIILTCVSGTLYQRAIGAYQIAHHARTHGYTAQVIDFTDYFDTNELVQAVEKFVDASTLCIGISTTFYEVDKKAKRKFINDKVDNELFLPENITETCTLIRDKHPHVKFVLGGAARSMSVSSLPFVDAIIPGYAENKFMAYLDRLTGKVSHIFPTRQGKQLIEQEYDGKFDIQDLNHRFLPQDLIMDGETLPIEISRGCIFKCKFCAYPLNGKTKNDYLRSPKCVAAEMRYNYQMFGTTNYYFADDTFNDSTAKLRDLYHEIMDLKFKIKFTAYLRIDLLNAHRDQIPMLKSMGLVSPFFGIETLNYPSAKAIGKGMESEKVKEFLLELDELWNHELPFTCSFITGLPYETEQTLQATFEWLKGTNINYVFFPLLVNQKSYYKSEFEKEFDKYGYHIKPDGTWESENMTFERASKIAEEYNNHGMFANTKPASWFLMSLLSNGYTLEQAKATMVKDLDWKHILETKRNRINEYKARLLALNNKSSGATQYQDGSSRPTATSWRDWSLDAASGYVRP